MHLGLIVILVGVLYLFKGLGYITSVDWSILWPTLTIIIGTAILLRSTRYHHYGHVGGKWNTMCDCDSCEGNKCVCDCDSCEDCEKGSK